MPVNVMDSRRPLAPQARDAGVPILVARNIIMQTPNSCNPMDEEGFEPPILPLCKSGALGLYATRPFFISTSDFQML